MGRRYGALVIEEMRGRETWGGKHMPTYLCRCDCGNGQVVHHVQLHHPRRNSRVTACDTCRHRRECVVCGRVFQSQQYKTSCSPECLTEYKRRKTLESYHRRSAANPEFNRAAASRKKEILAQDPARAALARQRELERSRRRRAAMTDEERAADLERLRLHYKEHALEIRAGRRERFMALPPIERARVYARWLQNHRDWYDRHRDERREQRRIMFEADPEGWLAYKRERRSIQAKKRAQAELAGLAKALQRKLTQQD